MFFTSPLNNHGPLPLQTRADISLLSNPHLKPPGPHQCIFIERPTFFIRYMFSQFLMEKGTLITYLSTNSLLAANKDLKIAMAVLQVRFPALFTG